MRVMIVDDNKQVRRMIRSFIDDLVSEFVECEDGSDVLESFEKHQPDLVLMDFQMKTMNGFEATREIKKEYPLAHVVIVSQWDSAALREAAAESGADAYVNKKSLLPLRDFIRYGPAIFKRQSREGK